MSRALLPTVRPPSARRPSRSSAEIAAGRRRRRPRGDGNTTSRGTVQAQAQRVVGRRPLGVVVPEQPGRPRREEPRPQCGVGPGLGLGPSRRARRSKGTRARGRTARGRRRRAGRRRCWSAAARPARPRRRCCCGVGALIRAPPRRRGAAGARSSSSESSSELGGGGVRFFFFRNVGARATSRRSCAAENLACLFSISEDEFVTIAIDARVDSRGIVLRGMQHPL